MTDDDEEFTRKDVVTLLLEVMDWTYVQATRERPMTEAEQKVLNDIRTALAAPSEDIETLRRENERLQNLLYDQIGKVTALRATEQMRKQIAELKHAENERLKAERDEAVKAEREACCKIVYGLCESDNVAQRTVEAIRARGEENKS